MSLDLSPRVMEIKISKWDLIKLKRFARQSKQPKKKKGKKSTGKRLSLSLGFTFLAGGFLSPRMLDSVDSVSFSRSGNVYQGGTLHGSQHQHYSRILLDSSYSVFTTSQEYGWVVSRWLSGFQFKWP